MAVITVTIPRRSRESIGEPRIQTYIVEIEDCRNYSVMDILELIYQTQDPTLAFFHHAACKQAACGQCLLLVNEKLTLACREPACGTMNLGPRNGRVVKDLICEMGGNI